VDKELTQWLKLSGFVQLLGGVASSGSPASGVLTIMQPSAGAQLTATWRGVQFAVQGAVSITDQTGQPSTAEINLTPQITIPVGTPPKREHRTNPADLTDSSEMLHWV
jgi:hypothetical protein